MTQRRKKKTPTPPHILEAWTVYVATRDSEDENQAIDENTKILLIQHYQFLVKNIMRPFWSKKPSILDMDDLLQAGNLGLIQAVERYNPSSDASFETFAQRRVRGAILDEINSLDWTPRNVRKQIRMVIKAENKLTSEDRPITTAAVAEEAELTESEVEDARAYAHRTYIHPVDHDSIREMENEHGEDQIASYFGVGSTQNDEGLDFRIMTMQALTEEEQRIIFLKVFCKEPASQIARILDIPVLKVSSIQRRAMDKLRKVYSDMRNDNSY